MCAQRREMGGAEPDAAIIYVHPTPDYIPVSSTALSFRSLELLHRPILAM
ncbi:hypothetical protein ACFLV7_14165 [Chloroflexota bacterium]